MAISEKIIKQIKDMPLEENMKELIIEVLEKEDEGLGKYKEVYEKIINDYIKKEESELQNEETGEVIDD